MNEEFNDWLLARGFGFEMGKAICFVPYTSEDMGSEVVAEAIRLDLTFMEEVDGLTVWLENPDA